MNAVDALLDQVRAAVEVSDRPRVFIERDLGISQKHLSMIMRGHADPSLNLLRRMCDVLGIVREP